jgi:hypothetical protein
MNSLEKFLYWLSKTDPDIVEQCPKNVKMNQMAMGISVLLTGILAFFSGSFAIQTVFENWVASYFVGLIYAAIIITIDREIVSAASKKAALIRFPIAILVGLIVATPLELKIFEQRLDQELNRQGKNENKVAFDRLKEFEEQYNDRKAGLEAEIKKYRESIQEYSTYIEAEVVGRVMAGRTGIAGYGPAYHEAKRVSDETEKLLREAQKELKDLNKNYENDLNRVTVMYDKEKIEPTYDLLAKMEALEIVTSKSASASRIGWCLVLLIMLIEIMPSLIKLFSRYDEYGALLETRTRVNIQRIHAMGNEHLVEIENSPFKVPDPSLLQQVKQYPLAS